MRITIFLVFVLLSPATASAQWNQRDRELYEREVRALEELADQAGRSNKRNNEHDRLGFFKSVPEPKDIFAGQGPVMPSYKELAEQALKVKQQRLGGEAQYILNSLLNDTTWTSASLAQKRQLLANWKANVWPQYANQAYGTDLITRMQYESYVFGTLDNALKAAENPL